MVEVAPCDNTSDPESSANLPCYQIAVNDDPMCESGLDLDVYYTPGYTVPPGTRAIASCIGDV